MQAIDWYLVAILTSRIYVCLVTGDLKKVKFERLTVKQSTLCDTKYIIESCKCKMSDSEEASKSYLISSALGRFRHTSIVQDIIHKPGT